MPSKKRKYNARFPAGRIKKIMQTDEEVGKVAQAVPIIISRTLELFVQSLLSKALQVTTARNAKTLSPSHVKQCILAEARFDFLRDLVKNIPDVSAAEEKELMSAESSPNSSSRFSDMPVQTRSVREDSNSSSSSDVRLQQTMRARSIETESRLRPDVDMRMKPDVRSDVTSTIVSGDVMDLTKKSETKPVAANFYQETLVDDNKSVIKVNPTYSPQPSTSTYPNDMGFMNYVQNNVPIPKSDMFFLDVRQNNNSTVESVKTPSTPILNIDFTKSLAKPEIKVLEPTAANIVGVQKDTKKIHRQNSKAQKEKEVKKVIKPLQPPQIDIDHINSGNLQIDEDYDT